KKERPGLAELVAAGLRDRERVVGDGRLVDEEGERVPGDAGSVEDARQGEAGDPDEPPRVSAPRSGQRARLRIEGAPGRDPAHQLIRYSALKPPGPCPSKAGGQGRPWNAGEGNDAPARRLTSSHAAPR